jgi:hypothetical protein
MRVRPGLGDRRRLEAVTPGDPRREGPMSLGQGRMSFLARHDRSRLALASALACSFMRDTSPTHFLRSACSSDTS